MADRAVGSFIGQRNSTVTSPASGIYNLGATANAGGNWPDNEVSAVFDPYLVTSIGGSNNFNVWNSHSSTHPTIASKTGHLLFIQASTNFYTDCQLDKITVDGTNIWTDPLADNAGWKQSPDYFGAGTSSNHASHSDRYLSAYKAQISSDKYSMMSHLSGLTYNNLITNTGSGAGQWQTDSQGTGSSGTSSTVDADGNNLGYYIYFEASGAQTQAALLKSPQITLDSSPNISFSYSRYGTGFAFVQLEVWFVPSY